MEQCSNKYTLVTGGLGYIGSHTVISLVEAGHLVVIIDDLSNSQLTCLNRLEEILKVKLPFRQVNLLDERAVRKVFDEFLIESVIHFAAKKAVGESVSKPLDYYYNNVSGTLVLLRVMADFSCKQFIFSSSACVYGANPECKEEANLNAMNPYGQTKVMVEQMLRDLCASDKEFVAIALRYFNPIGAHESGKIGESPNDIPNNLMPYIQKVAAGKLPHLNVFGTDYNTSDGTGIRDYIHVMDLAQGHISAMEFCSQKSGFHVFNLGTGRGTSVLELVAAFEEASGVKIPLMMTERRAGDTEKLMAIPAKANEILKWKAERNIDEMCRDAWNWTRENPNGYE